MLAFGALGIVYGDIGTSPIYAIRETFDNAGLDATTQSAYGVASVVFWALVIVISIKYLSMVMRADNHGEGGILAFTALVAPSKGNAKGVLAAVVTLGVFGTALLYGDGLITPAISVLSAVEGFEVASTAFQHFVIPISIVILVGLFAVQRHGTARISSVFGPVMLVWFGTLGVLGLNQVVRHPGVVRAVSPTYAVDFFVNQPGNAFVALGSIFLVVTGGEALYADMGHFGRRPIQFSWYVLVLPALLLNYFGQAALVVADPETVESPFYRLAPSWAILPLAVLATCATVIASQALDLRSVLAHGAGGAARLSPSHADHPHVAASRRPDLCPGRQLAVDDRVCRTRAGVPDVEQSGVGLRHRRHDDDADHDVAVLPRCPRPVGWSLARTFAVCIPLFVVDIAFLSANFVKIASGGWFPLLVGLILVVLMTTWRKGRQLVAARIHRGERPIEVVVHEAVVADAARVPGIAVYMFKDAGAAPPALIANITHNHVLHQLTLMVSVETDDIPRVPAAERLTTRKVGSGIQQVTLRFGYLDDPDVPSALALLQLPGQDFDPDTVTYFIGRESVSATKAPGMHPARERLFVAMNRSAGSATRFFSLPVDRVFEVGTLVEI